MTTFRQVVLVCPHCKTKLSGFDLMSYTVYQSTQYPDGKVETKPWQNRDTEIAICPECNKVFWRSDAIIESEDYPDEELPSVGDVHDLPFRMQDDSKEQLIHFYNNLLNKGFANTVDRKIYLRLRIWWGINDFKRYRKPLFIELLKSRTIKRARFILKNRKELNKRFINFKPLFKENLEKLIAIYVPENPNESILLAEMYRQLGNESKAKKITSEANNSFGNNE